MKSNEQLGRVPAEVREAIGFALAEPPFNLSNNNDEAGDALGVICAAIAPFFNLPQLEPVIAKDLDEAMRWTATYHGKVAISPQLPAEVREAISSTLDFASYFPDEDPPYREIIRDKMVNRLCTALAPLWQKHEGKSGHSIPVCQQCGAQLDESDDSYYCPRCIARKDRQ